MAALVVALAGTTAWPLSAAAAEPRRGAVKIGVSLALTGPDARWGIPMLRGIELGVEEANPAGGPGGHPLETVVLDSAGPGLEGISHWRGMNNYERLIADPAVIAAIGPQTSGEGRAVAPLVNRADLATITPSATTFDVTDPALQARFRPGGRSAYFRTVGTDLAQGPAMARFAHDRLGVRRVVLIDDGTAFGVRTVLGFARRAGELGMAVLGRKQVRWTEGDYRRELREVQALHPEAVFFAGGQPVGVKLARQAAGILPSVHRLAAESLFDRGFAIQAGTAAEGWYVSNVAADLAASPGGLAWADRFRRRFGDDPSPYSLSAHTAVMVIRDAVGRLAARGRSITRPGVREAIQSARLADTPQGTVSYDANGDLERPVVSIYQVRDEAFRYLEAVTLAGAPRPAADGALSRP
jgi:branched-chain amino acid transport system substrate-binding protein